MAAQFLVETIFGLYLMVVILRIWLQLARADFYNPFSQFVVKATHPIVGPMRRFIPSFGNFDTSSFVLAFAVAALKITVIQLLFRGGFAGILPVSIEALITLVFETLNLMFWILIIRAILSWVSQGYSPIEMMLQQLTEPFLAPIRKVIPPMGGLDLSLLVAIIGLQFFQFLFKDMLAYVI